MQYGNFNNQIKKKGISFDIDFENIKENTITTKNEIKEPNKVEVIPNEEDPEEANKEQILYKCPYCSRKFKRESYAKHVPVCEKVFHGKNEQDNKKTKEKEKEKDKEKDKKNEKKGFAKKAKWENQSDELRAIIQSKRANKGKTYLYIIF